MLFDSIESVLKTQPDESQLDSLNKSLAKCKYAKQSNSNLKNLRVELGIDEKINGSSKDILNKISADFELENNSDNDQNRYYSFNKKIQSSNEIPETSNLFPKDILLSPDERKIIETLDIQRRKFYEDKKKEIKTKISAKVVPEPESMLNLKKQQKIFEQEIQIPEITVLKSGKKILEHSDKMTQLDQSVKLAIPQVIMQKDKEIYKHEIQELHKKLIFYQERLKLINQTIEQSKFRDVINHTTKNLVQQNIKEIDEIFKNDDGSNVNFLKNLEAKYSKSVIELEKSVEKEILEKKHSEEEILKIKKVEEERLKNIQRIQKFTTEISKYKTFLADIKSLNEKRVIEIEAKNNLIQSLANESLLNQMNNLKCNQVNLINQIDNYLNQIEKENYPSLIDSFDQTTSDKILKNIDDNINKFQAQTQQSKSKIDLLQNNVQLLLTEFVEAKKAKEKLELEQQRLKEMEAKLIEKAMNEKLAKEIEAKKAKEKLELEQQRLKEMEAKLNEKLTKEIEAKKYEEKTKTLESFNRIQSVDENNKAGINRFTFEIYKKVEKQIDQIRKESEDALNVKEFKLYKFELQKAINFPLNSLLGTNENSDANFHEKIKTLLRLLSGQTCKVTSSITIDTSKHPRAIDFCLVYLGRKIVEKGEETVSSRPNTSFEYVQVIIEIIKAKNEFETILMGQLQERCPYIVPFYKPRIRSQTDQQYYESLGYKIIDGKIEEDVHFYKRMNGVFYLYFTLLISGNTTYFSVKRAWQWLADVLNMAPRPNITAEMLTIFFKCCGYILQKIYKKQFIKMVNIFKTEYLKLIQSISPEKQSNAAVGRLTNILDQFQQNGYFYQWKKSTH